MRAVRGEVASSKPVSLTKAARVFSLFAASGESGLPSDDSALLLCAAEAALELHAFRRHGGASGQSEEERPRKRKNEACSAASRNSQRGIGTVGAFLIAKALDRSCFLYTMAQIMVEIGPTSYQLKMAILEDCLQIFVHFQIKQISLHLIVESRYRVTEDRSLNSELWPKVTSGVVML
uniref:Uncharacterized protein n=1 Tax=Oryza brachyantha TaxID=4533 RepID=J3LJA2_ORYBR